MTSGRHPTIRARLSRDSQFYKGNADNPNYNKKLSFSGTAQSSLRNQYLGLCSSLSQQPLLGHVPAGLLLKSRRCIINAGVGDWGVVPHSATASFRICKNLIHGS